MFIRKLALAVALTAGLGLAAPVALAAKPEIYTPAFSQLAIEGYDVVSYFSAGGPVRGERAITSTYRGATWRFATAANKAAFDANPAAFAPQYGGYCAWAVSQGYTASGDPEFWAIVDGKLYLNYNARVQRDWDVDRAGFIRSANTNWPTVLGR
jgi:YHS domain-containing protein